MRAGVVTGMPRMRHISSVSNVSRCTVMPSTRHASAGSARGQACVDPLRAMKRRRRQAGDSGSASDHSQAPTARVTGVTACPLGRYTLRYIITFLLRSVRLLAPPHVLRCREMASCHPPWVDAGIAVRHLSTSVDFGYAVLWITRLNPTLAGNQCAKWRAPGGRGRRRLAAASVTWSSRTDPPGCTIALTPAPVSVSRPSGNGKNASDAATPPARGRRPAARRAGPRRPG